MFDFKPKADAPGFRVGLQEPVPGFRVGALPNPPGIAPRPEPGSGLPLMPPWYERWNPLRPFPLPWRPFDFLPVPAPMPLPEPEPEPEPVLPVGDPALAKVVKRS